MKSTERELAGPTMGPCSHEASGHAEHCDSYKSVVTEADLVFDGDPAYETKRQGEYTVADYLALPEDGPRYELIDGYLFVMESPLTIHQDVIGKLYTQFAAFLEKQEGDCEVYLSPIDVQLDRDDKTMVQPDLVVNCDRKRLTRRGFYGAPDLLVEILSPTTRKKDMVLKLSKYEKAGVREYWMIDPEAKTVAVYFFCDSRFPRYYTFDDRVPVNIWMGRLAIDFAFIRDRIAYLDQL